MRVIKSRRVSCAGYVGEIVNTRTFSSENLKGILIILEGHRRG